MDVDAEAARLLDATLTNEQAAARIDPSLIPAVRSAVRRLARARGVRLRTGIVDDAVVVVLVDAAVWHEPVSVMRAKLTPAPHDDVAR